MQDFHRDRSRRFTRRPYRRRSRGLRTTTSPTRARLALQARHPLRARRDRRCADHRRGLRPVPRKAVPEISGKLTLVPVLRVGVVSDGDASIVRTDVPESGRPRGANMVAEAVRDLEAPMHDEPARPRPWMLSSWVRARPARCSTACGSSVPVPIRPRCNTSISCAGMVRRTRTRSTRVPCSSIPTPDRKPPSAPEEGMIPLLRRAPAALSMPRPGRAWRSPHSSLGTMHTDTKA